MFGRFKRKRPAAESPIRPLTSTQELEEALMESKSGGVLLFKHSAACGVSFFARNEVLRLTEEHDPTVFEVVVQKSRALSSAIAERFGIRHASPQAILVRDGEAVWNASHGRITDSAVREAMKAGLMALVLVLTGCAPSQDGPAPEQQPVDPVAGAVINEELPPAPAFELPTLSGGTYRLEDQRGKVLVINFWATWCGPCVRETPGLVALHEELSDRGLEVVGVSVDQEGFEVIAPFAERFEVTYPMLLDDGTVGDAFGGVYAMPSTFVVDREGRVAHRVVGEFPFEDMRPRLEALLGE
ncbi:MAG: bacillithiol system redox-active protein YtxJ [Rhodothermales bacterium]|nr:bacillithiol system redox-active protein YtxJ [Rhodothermales bacterium]